MASSTKTKSTARPSARKKGSGAKSSRSKASARVSNGSSLVIVESPAKARTIERILGDEYLIRASRGHVRDLPKGKLGVDLEKGFDPSYLVVKDKADVVKELKDLGAKAPSIYLATDPDREGEAISWHLVKAAAWDKGAKPLHRVVFHEITRDAVKQAFDHPRSLDMELVNAQQARRILDRLVGYQISPLLWRKVQRGLSAGRVQSVALRMVVDREKEIRAFVPREYWTIEARLRKTDAARSKNQDFTALLHSVKGQKGKLKIENEDRAREVEADLKGARYAVSQVKTREVKQSPAPPFITSTLQQEAFRKLKFSAKRTMVAAQQLYEGLDMGSEGAVGLITYMRTDSTNVAYASIQEARRYIEARFGDDYLPEKPRAFKRKAKGAQEAHEAIRPTSITRTPDDLKGHLSRDQHRLYDLIWRRMLASQMAEARSDSTTVETEAGGAKSQKTYLFRSTGSVLTFPGFRTLYMESVDDAEEDTGKGPPPGLKKGDALNCLGIDPKQHFTQPPPRYTEASLIKGLEEKGIGRPSTYAPIISTIMDRHYVVKKEGKLSPTDLGEKVCDLLVDYFTDIMDTNFTAKMEEELDEVARGERQWVPMLEDFYGPFQKALDVATEQMPRVRVEEATDQVCEKCGKPMVIKMGRFGRFMSCSGFPECRNTGPVPSESNGAQAESQESAAPETIDEVCEKCGKAMEIRTGGSASS